MHILITHVMANMKWWGVIWVCLKNGVPLESDGLLRWFIIILLMKLNRHARVFPSVKQMYL